MRDADGASGAGTTQGLDGIARDVVIARDHGLQLLAEGGLAAIAQVNERKARKLYDEIDRTGFYRGTAAKDCRSLMNVTFRLATEDLEKTFVKESTAAGLDGLKGHRSVGGMRASIYNAFPEAGIDALVQFMREFERTRG